MSFVVATDVGGTCTDTVVVDNGKTIFIGKALSTPPNFAQGVIDSIQSAADAMGLSLNELFDKTSLFTHGCTVVDNTLLERSGSTTGLLTTEGFEDTLLVTRGAYGRWSGLTEEGLKHPVATDRPEPLVGFDYIRGVAERVDYKGAVIRELDESGVAESVAYLLEEKKVDALAVCLLWSFNQPKHEQRIKEIINTLSADTYVTISSDIAPVPGEYERTSTTVINAYAGRVVRDYIHNLEELLSNNGYKGPLLVMQGYGGLLPAKEAADRAVTMLECGPVAGVIGSKFLGDLMGDSEVIAADMGGTTFKVGIIQNGELEYAREPLIDRFHYSVPKIDVSSIGSGGGSLITLEEGTLVPQVGPESAGARPGPVCYGLGGTQPTLTDVLLLIGYIDPSRFLNETMQLDIESAHNIFKEKIAAPLNLSVHEAAFGIFRIATAQITDLIHKITVEQGLDPRDFVLHSFGGSCPMLASTFGQELNVKRIVVPYAASVNCAFGLATANIVHEYSVIDTKVLPVSAEEINKIYAPLLVKAKQALSEEGFSEDKIECKWSIGFRYALQVHEINTPVRSATPLSEDGLARLVNDFEHLYENKYGKGSAYRDAGIELTQFRLTASGLIDRPEIVPQTLVDSDASHALSTQREIFVEAKNALASANIYDFDLLKPGNEISGPAVIHTPITTIVIQQDQTGKMDTYRNIIIEQNLT
jgi:N-methylhydantoinase A